MDPFANWEREEGYNLTTDPSNVGSLSTIYTGCDTVFSVAWKTWTVLDVSNIIWLACVCLSLHPATSKITDVLQHHVQAKWNKRLLNQSENFQCRYKPTVSKYYYLNYNVCCILGLMSRAYARKINQYTVNEVYTGSINIVTFNSCRSGR